MADEGEEDNDVEEIFAAEGEVVNLGQWRRHEAAWRPRLDFGEDEIAPWSAPTPTTPVGLRVATCWAGERGSKLSISLSDADVPNTEDGLEPLQGTVAFFAEEQSRDQQDGVRRHRFWPSIYGRSPVLRFFSLYQATPSDDEGPVLTTPLKEDAQVLFRIFKAPQHPLLLQTLERAGLEATRQDDWNLLWGARMKEEQHLTLNPHQKVGHFPGTFHLGRKDHLFRHLQRMRRVHGAQVYDFVPQTFFLPQDLKLLAEALASNGDGGYAPFIVKPPAGACGRGIYLVDHASQVEPAEDGGLNLAQRYIANPLLVNGYKFDLRLYVLLTGIDPLKVHLYPEGLVRFASEKYVLDPTTLDKEYIHLTNYAINSKAAEKGDTDSPGVKWLLSHLAAVLQRCGVAWAEVWARVQDLVVKTLLAVEPIVCSKVAQVVKRRNSCYELFGMDVLLDDELNPYLLEINPMPSLHATTPLDRKLKAELMAEVLDLVGVAPYDRQAFADHVEAAKQARQTGLKGGREGGVSGGGGGSNNIPITSKKRPPIEQLWKPDFCALLGAEERAVLQDYMEERGRARRFTRLYPTPEAEVQYAALFETPRWLNALLCRWEQALASPQAAAFEEWLLPGSDRAPVPLLLGPAAMPKYKTGVTEDPLPTAAPPAAPPRRSRSQPARRVPEEAGAEVRRFVEEPAWMRRAVAAAERPPPPPPPAPDGAPTVFADRAAPDRPEHRVQDTATGATLPDPPISPSGSSIPLAASASALTKHWYEARVGADPLPMPLPPEGPAMKPVPPVLARHPSIRTSPHGPCMEALPPLGAAPPRPLPALAPPVRPAADLAPAGRKSFTAPAAMSKAARNATRRPGARLSEAVPISVVTLDLGAVFPPAGHS